MELIESGNFYGTKLAKELSEDVKQLSDLNKNKDYQRYMQGMDASSNSFYVDGLR